MRYENDPIEKMEKHFSISLVTITGHDGRMYTDNYLFSRHWRLALKKPTGVSVAPSGAHGVDIKFVQELFESNCDLKRNGYYIPKYDCKTIRELRLLFRYGLILTTDQK